jgi:hypothetical protein
VHAYCMMPAARPPRYRERVTEEAEERERNLMAALDDAMQLMTAVNMHLHRLGRRLEPSGEADVTRQLETTVGQSIARLRGALAEVSSGARSGR